MVGVNGERLTYADEFKDVFATNINTPVLVQFYRNNFLTSDTVTPNSNGLIGTGLVNRIAAKPKHVSFGLIECLPYGFLHSYEVGLKYFKQFNLIFDKEIKGYEGVGGFISIGKIFPSEWDWQQFWRLTAFLSIMLGVLNLLPIPALDGGHVVFLLYEVVTRRKPHDKVLEYAQITGMVLLLALIVYANGNDIIRLFS